MSAAPLIPDIPKLGEMVYYYDEDKQPLPALVAHLFPVITSPSERPTCTLTIFNRDGKVAARVKIEPAYHNGTVWVLINKWSFPDEIPEEEYNYLSHKVKVKGRTVGAGESLIVSFT